MHTRRVADLMSAAPFLYGESSLATAAAAFREVWAPMLPVLDGNRVAGVVLREEVFSALLAGGSETSPVASVLREPPVVLQPQWTVEEALDRFRAAPAAPVAIVTDEEGRYLGLVRALDLFRPFAEPARPRQAGGMATPFGVYLTTGDVSAGAGPLALATTGALLFLLITACTLAVYWFWQTVPLRAPGWAIVAMLQFGPAVLFFAALKVLPLTRVHGAEHKVVHAIERGEPLTLEAARRMPRVHPRCGTNLAVGATLFIVLVNLSWPHVQELGALLAMLATLMLWRPVGAVFQQYLTTSEPTDRQLESALDVGRELVERYRASPRRRASFVIRLASSGLPWILLGATAAALALYGVGLATGLDFLLQ